ncbi:phage portal protein [Maridesulfovibrio ferrireducens]|uniref:phage portal protein n=1 Tax=Maridesulfovibrio ferrireducens TaxID=246191 RepID=UPI001A265FDF|nr:phage portal protein [Maridesulfovibrio ferrireducens]MBI9109993.1 phage portal protein [Maridesulfovibrio ferrireducens]
MNESNKLTLGERIYNGITSLVGGTLGLVSPGAALQYSVGRNAFLSYKAGSRRGANGKWNPRRGSADSMIRKDRTLVVARSRDLVRNSQYVSGALRKVCNNVVFKGIFPQAGIKKTDGTLDHDKNNSIEKLFKDWAKIVLFPEMQNLVLRHMWMDGEILVHFFIDLDLLEMGVVPLGVELIETDQLDTMVDGELSGGNYARRGIEYSRSGRPVAYHILPVHPGDGLVYRGATKRVPASDILHIFEKERASQSRGMPWLTTIVMAMHDFEDYQDSERIAARLMASFAYFIQRSGPSNPTENAFPGSVAANGQELPKYLSGPGQILEIPPNTEVNAQQYKRDGNAHESFSKTSLKGASVGAGVSYESFSNDYTDASYSSSRSATLEERRGYQVSQEYENTRFNTPVSEKFSFVAHLAGFLKNDTPLNIPVTWQTPGWTWVDPVKDSKASVIEVNELGITSRRELCAKQGKDYDEVTDQLERENNDLINRGLLEDKNAETKKG